MVYGLPKVYKEGNPLRWIFSFCDSLTYLTSKFLAGILQPLQGNSEYNVRDSIQVCEVFGQLKLEEDDVFVSYDVTNLFGSVPAEEAGWLALSRLEKDRPYKDLKRRTGHSLDSCRHLMETYT